jgi:hypothetical protein
MQMEVVWKPIQPFYFRLIRFCLGSSIERNKAAEDKRRLRNLGFCGGWKNGMDAWTQTQMSQAASGQAPGSESDAFTGAQDNSNKTHKSHFTLGVPRLQNRTCDAILKLDDSQRFSQ